MTWPVRPIFSHPKFRICVTEINGSEPSKFCHNLFFFFIALFVISCKWLYSMVFLATYRMLILIRSSISQSSCDQSQSWMIPAPTLFIQVFIHIFAHFCWLHCIRRPLVQTNPTTAAVLERKCVFLLAPLNVFSMKRYCALLLEILSTILCDRKVNNLTEYSTAKFSCMAESVGLQSVSVPQIPVIFYSDRR